MDVAERTGKLSHAVRRQVGAVIVKDREIITTGFNGMPRGVNDEINARHERPEKYHWFIHGEANAILKCAKNGHSCDGATIYQTHSPCRDCSKLILQSGLKRVVYLEDYKDLSGLEFFKSLKIQ